MTKTFYVSKSTDGNVDGAPTTDRFERIERLNMLLEHGWTIKNFSKTDNEEYFVLEKPD
jgi:hypothetical protein